MSREGGPFLGSGLMCSWWKCLSFSIINCSEFRQELCILTSLVLLLLLASTIICKILDLKKLNLLLMKKKMVLAALFQAPTGCWASCLVHSVYFDPYNHPGRKPCPSLFPDAEQGQRGEIPGPKLCNWLQSWSQSPVSQPPQAAFFLAPVP